MTPQEFEILKHQVKLWAEAEERILQQARFRKLEELTQEMDGRWADET